MMEAIFKIGEYAEKKSEDKSEIAKFVENPDVEFIVAINIKKDEDEYSFDKVSIEEFDKVKICSYLYRRGSSNGPDITPSSKITEPDKTFNKKIIKSLESIKEEFENYELFTQEKEFVEKLIMVLKNESSKIVDEITEKNPKSKRSNLLTLKINNKYIGEIEIFRKVMIRKSTLGFYNKYGKVSLCQNKQCSVCRKNCNYIYGFVSTYQFYTTDKPGMVTGGFEQKESWKNYPVCPVCAVILEKGKAYIDENLDFSFYGFNYYVIPKFIEDIPQEVMNIFEDQNKRTSIEGKARRKLTGDEREILSILSEQKNSMSNDLLFYQKDNSAFNIILHIEEILPSRFQFIFKKKYEVDKIELFKAMTIEIDEKSSLEFDFSILRNFFPRSKKHSTYDKSFIELIDKIFRGNKIDYQFLLKHIMEIIKRRFKSNYSTYSDSMKGMMLLYFIHLLGILRINERKEVKSMPEYSDKINEFFDEHKVFLDCNEKKSIFLTGVLTQLLLNIQYIDKKATPFRKRLKGLNMDMKDIGRVFAEAQNKLEEYGKNYYKDIERITASYFVNKENNKLSKDEINFFFVLGMNLHDKFKNDEDNAKGDVKK